MIRTAVQNDLPAIVDIYNQAIDAKFQTGFTKRLKTEERQAWFLEHNAQYPLLIFVADEQVVGWFSISPYRSGRAALRYTVEISYFIDKKYHHKGIGSQLMQAGLSNSPYAEGLPIKQQFDA
jgi:phosphinothricin acetyltransferase